MESRLFLLLLLSAVVLADDVVDYTDADFDNKIGDHAMAVVMFYAPWCGHCKRLKPEWEKAATILKDNDPPVVMAKVDCTEEGKATCSKFGVSGYPTLKMFRNSATAQDYNGPREANGIVKYLRSQVGPSAKELKTVADAEAYIAKNEVSVVYFGKDSKLKDEFLKLANRLRETVRFAYSSSEDINEKYGHEDATIVLFRPTILHNKFEPPSMVFEGAALLEDIEIFINDNYHGLVGHRTEDNMQGFKHPSIIAYYTLDYVRNVKGTNYWRNRILKVAQNYNKDFSFAVSNSQDFSNELTDFGIEYAAGDKPVICARDTSGLKYTMKEEFTMATFEAFLKQFKNGELTPHIKSEPIPETQDAVKVAVGKNFDEIVTNSGRDALVEFYAPWCGHCKKLVPIYDELGERMKNEDIDIVKVDATANDTPQTYNVRGFPTIFWKPAQGEPIAYEGGREVEDFINYIAKYATNELNGYTRNGQEKKQEHIEL